MRRKDNGHEERRARRDVARSIATFVPCCLAALLLSSSAGGQPPRAPVEPVPGAERAEAVGLWRVPRDRRAVTVAPNAVALPLATRFAYDGRTVVLYLLTLSPDPRRPRADDDHYRLPARWVGDGLQYQIGTRWYPLARFRGGRFEGENGGASFVYERVDRREDLDPDDHVLLRPRELRLP